MVPGCTIPNIPISPSVRLHGCAHQHPPAFTVHSHTWTLECACPSGVRAHIFTLPVGAVMCVHMCATPGVSGHMHRHIHQVLGCRWLYSRVCDVQRVRHPTWVAGAHTELLVQMCTHVAWIQAADARATWVLETKSAKLGWVYTLFSPPFL